MYVRVGDFSEIKVGGILCGKYALMRGLGSFLECQEIIILERIGHVLGQKTVVEGPVEPALRLDIGHYRLGRGTLSHYIRTMCSWLSRVAAIAKEESEAIVEILWVESVSKYMPNSENTFRDKIIDMKQMWQWHDW